MNTLLTQVLLVAFGFALAFPARGQVVISEFLAGNSSNLTDQDGAHSDWIELHNPGNAPVNLQGWSLADNEDSIGWKLPSLELAPGAYAIVFASGKDRAVAGAELHANFSLSIDGEYLALIQPGGTVAMEFEPGFPKQLQDVSYGSFQGAWQYFTQPTPGAANTRGMDGLVGDTKFSHDRGFYEAPFDLVIRTETLGAAIYYTTNGTVPSATNGVVYSGPIRIAGTTVLRAAAFKEGYLPSSIDTQTYLFLEDVIRQSPVGKAPPGWPSSWGSNTVDYGMDPAVVDNPLYSSTIKEDLRTISSISLVMNLSDLFDSRRGIYANPGQDGINWERPCSVELINPDGSKGFQVNAGVRIRGGYSRSTSNPKHAFRLFFREEYGDAKLVYPLFGDKGASEFDALDLRTFQNYSWSFEGDSRGVFIRDQFSRDAQLAMGHQGERGDYHHLYINGQYWGLFNTAERPEASYGETYYGGNKEDYDVVKVAADSGYIIYATDGNLEAWTRLWNAAKAGLSSDAAYQKIQGNHPDGTRNPEYEVLLDVDNLIDYMLVILYGGNLDAPISNFLGNTSPNNFFALRNRDGRHGFQFFAHDAEHTLLNVSESRIGPYSAGSTLSKSNPQWIWQQCWTNPEFRLRVADRVQKHFFNEGVLTPQGATNLFLKRVAEIDRAVVGESARWGDSKRSAPRTRNVEWIAEVNRIAKTYMAQRTGTVLNQLRSKNLFPNLAAPSFSQHGGNIQKGYPLSMSAPAGTIYYTLNGADPRLIGGERSPSALVYGSPVPLTESVTVKARALDGATWSALNEAEFTVIQTFTELSITELMFNPAPDPATDRDEFEFLELKNASATEMDLGGVHFTDGITFEFPKGTRLGAGQFAVLVANPAAFAARYPGVPVSGVYSGRLANSGETVAYAHAVGTPIFSVTFGDTAPWPISADGDGFSLVPMDANRNDEPSDPSNWRASSRIGGSPGADDAPPGIQPVWVNEVLTHTDAADVDKVELFNPGPESADLSYWYLSDSRSTPKKFRIPAGTVIPPGGYRVFAEADFNPPGGESSFAFDATGEEVFLHSADAAGNLTGFSDGFVFEAAASGVTFGRYVTSAGQIHYPAQRAPTLGAENAGPLVGPVVINEIEYRPATGSEEFVELKNITASSVPLFDPSRPTNTWRLDGVGFQFPPSSEVPAQGLALVVANDPAMFRARYGVPASVPIFGPYTGALQDGGEELRLQRPDAPTANTGGGETVPLVTVDAVRYSDKAPWPANAAGLGSSLERINPAAYGDDPANWRASFLSPSPGFENDGNRVPRVNAGTDLTLQATVFPLMGNVGGTAVDDGQPNPPGNLMIAWTQVSGPGPVVFGSAGQLQTTVSFPGIGTYVLRLTADDGALQGADEVSVTIERTPSAVAFIPQGAVWKYLDDGSNQGALWRTPEFDDSVWRSGPAVLGYGEGSERTVIEYGPDRSNKYVTSYFRHPFNVASAASVKELTVRVLRDDGAIVYLNGIEVFRSNMPAGDIGPTTFASSVVGGGDESTFYDRPVNPSALRDGANVMAVEIHQANAASTDLSFDLELNGLVSPDNQPPAVEAGQDLAVVFGADVPLQGAALDDGLPDPPGQLAISWSKVAGPGEVVFAQPGSAVTTARFSAPGTYTLRLSAKDGSFSREDEMTVTVTGESYEQWKAGFFTAAELADETICGEPADPDEDGHSNLAEFNAGTDPKDPASVLKAAWVGWNGAADEPLILRFEAKPNRSYTVQLQDEIGGPWLKLADVPAIPGGGTAEVKDFAPSASGTRFYRIITPQQL